MKTLTSVALFWIHFAVFANCLSAKARKLATSYDDSSDNLLDGVEATTEIDDFFDDFGGFDDEKQDAFDASPEVQVALCQNLTQAELEEGVECTNETRKSEPKEVRYPDLFLQRLITQMWADFQDKLNNDAEVKGRVIDPLDVDALMKEPIELVQKGSLYSADVKMSGIQMFGLSGINLKDAIVTRDENLTNLISEVTFAFDEIVINGTYTMKGFFGWWTLDSKGEQPFLIGMKNATFSVQVRMGIVKGTKNWDSFKCGPDGNVIITELGFPLKYEDIDFRFHKLGAFANNVVNGIGIYFLQVQEQLLKKKVKEMIKKGVNSLIC